MNRILELAPSQEDAVVARILVLVHQAIDEQFPSIAQTNRQFTKTVFSGDGESTAIGPVPTDDRQQFLASEDTSPTGKSSAAAGGGPHQVPPPPPRPGLARDPSQSSPMSGAKSLQAADTGAMDPIHPMVSGIRGTGAATASTRLDSTIEGLRVKPPIDWMTIVFLGLLVAGVILLIYALVV